MKKTKLMNLQEAADFLDLSVHTLYKMVQQDRIPALKIGRLWRFRKDQLFNWGMKRWGKQQRREKVRCALLMDQLDRKRKCGSGRNENEID